MVVCAAVVVAQGAAAVPIRPEVFARRVCATRVSPNRYVAYDQYTLPIFWTFSFSFYPGEGEGEWYGCLRFYFRDSAKEAYVGNFKSAVPVPCTSLEPDKVVKRSITPNSIPGYPVPEVNTGDLPPFLFNQPTTYGEFRGGHIECKMDIQGSMHTLAASPAFTGTLQSYGLNYRDVLAVSSNAGNPMGFGEPATHAYTYFTTVAAVGITDLDAAHPSENPLIFYLPDSQSISEEMREGFGFAVPATDDQMFTYRVTLQSLQFMPGSKGCDFENSEGMYVQSQFDGSKFGQSKYPVVSFAHLSWPPKTSQRVKCQKSDIKSLGGQSDLQTRVRFNIGPATLYIGYDPNNPKEPFFGNMYEVFFDPDSASKDGG